MTAAPEFSRPLAASDIGAATRRAALEATAAERAALAIRFGLVSLAGLSAVLEVKREAAGIRVTGDVRGEGEQACVASAEPVPFKVSDRIDLLLAEMPDGSEIELAEDQLDIEPFAGEVIDLGEIAAQAFALALDPYPRRPGSVPGIITEEEAIMARSPFAVLKKD